MLGKKRYVVHKVLLESVQLEIKGKNILIIEIRLSNAYKRIQLRPPPAQVVVGFIQNASIVKSKVLVKQLLYKRLATGLSSLAPPMTIMPTPITKRAIIHI